MTYSLVSANTVASNAGGTSLTPTCTSTTAHNLLVLLFSYSGSLSSPTFTLPAGWLSAPQVFANAACISQIFYYPDCPAGITSAAITWGGIPNSACAGQILEFHDSAGTNTSPLDVTGSITSDVTTPVPVATGSATTAASDLAVCAFTGQYTSATKDTLVQGAGFTHGGNYGDAVKQNLHSGFDYELDTGATGTVTDSVTFTGPFTVAAGAIATFKVYTPPSTAPTVVVYKDAYTIQGAGSRILTQRTVATGDVIAVTGVGGDFTARNITSLAQSAGTATIGTITTKRDAGTTGHCSLVLWTFTVTSGGTLTLTAGFSTTTTDHFTFWTYVATGCGGVGNTAMTTTSTTTVTASLTTSANSYVLATAGDWSGIGGATTTLTPAGGVLDAHETDGVVDQVANGTIYSARGGHWADTGSPATVSYGVTVPTSAKYNLVVCELLGSAGAPAGLLPQQIRMRRPAVFTRIANPSRQAVYSR